MTLLISWVGVDTHGVSSAYIAADSRIRWSDLAFFDHGRKVFAFSGSPDVLGYCGDVLFPTMVLSQIKEMADSGLLFASKATCKERFEAIKEKLVQQFHAHPRMVELITAPILQVIHISRDFHDNKKYSCWLIEWRRGSGWAAKNIAMPPSSDILFSLGSGSTEFNDNYARYKSGKHHETSRSVFHCFCDTLFNIKDNNCRGAPQLVGIYRKPNSPAVTYGIIRNGQRYFLGARIGDNVSFEKIEWRNDLFERCDGYSMRRLTDAQAQPDNLRRQSQSATPWTPTIIARFHFMFLYGGGEVLSEVSALIAPSLLLRVKSPAFKHFGQVIIVRKDKVSDANKRLHSDAPEGGA